MSSNEAFTISWGNTCLQMCVYVYRLPEHVNTKYTSLTKVTCIFDESGATSVPECLTPLAISEQPWNHSRIYFKKQVPIQFLHQLFSQDVITDSKLISYNDSHIVECTLSPLLVESFRTSVD